MTKKTEKSEKITFYEALADIEINPRLRFFYERKYSKKNLSLKEWKKLLK